MITEKIPNFESLDPTRQIEFVSDVAELLHHRQLVDGPANELPCFHDPEFDQILNDPFDNRELSALVDFLGSLVSDKNLETGIRSTASFALGKTASLKALVKVVEAIKTRKLPPELLRQCAFAFDSLCDLSGADKVVPQSIETDFVSAGLPWDKKASRLLIDEI